MGIASTDEFDVRKLVKKDKELSTYSFVSFKVACSVEIFNVLLDPMKWPRNSRIREFDLERRTSSGVRLTQQSTSDTEVLIFSGGTTNHVETVMNQRSNDLLKNEQETPIVSMETELVQ